MKRILLVCCLLTATCAATLTHVQAQSFTAAVTSSIFTAKVNQLDAYIASGDTTNSRITWNAIHALMIQEFGSIKYSLNAATSAADRTTYMNLHNTQYNLYKQAWTLKNDLVTNRSALHTTLMNYAGTL